MAVSLVLISFSGVTRFETPRGGLFNFMRSLWFLFGQERRFQVPGSNNAMRQRTQCRLGFQARYVCIFGCWAVPIPFLYLHLLQSSYILSLFISVLWYILICSCSISTWPFGNLGFRLKMVRSRSSSVRYPHYLRYKLHCKILK